MFRYLLLLMDGPFESASLRGEIVGNLEHLWPVFHCLPLFANHVLQIHDARLGSSQEGNKNESCCEEKRLKTRTNTNYRTVPTTRTSNDSASGWLQCSSTWLWPIRITYTQTNLHNPFCFCALHMTRSMDSAAPCCGKGFCLADWSEW